MENIDFIPIFEWTVLNNNKDRADLKNTYQISDSYNIFGTDNNGNILVVYEDKLFQIDHEEPTENPYLLANDFSLLEKLFLKLLNIQECTIETPLKEIKETKKKIS